MKVFVTTAIVIASGRVRMMGVVVVVVVGGVADVGVARDCDYGCDY